MFDRFLRSKPATQAASAPTAPAAAAGPTTAGDTATVRRIVAKLEAMPPEQARLLAAAAYTLARAANADLEISEDETAAIERELQEGEHIDEPTAVMVTEMAKLQAKTVGGTEDYVVTREFREISTMEQRIQLIRCCFAIEAADGTINAEEASVTNEIARELDIERADLNAVRDEFHEQLSSVQALRQVGGA